MEKQLLFHHEWVRWRGMLSFKTAAPVADEIVELESAACASTSCPCLVGGSSRIVLQIQRKTSRTMRRTKGRLTMSPSPS